MKKTLVIMFFLLSTNYIISQDLYTISGRVLEKRNSEEIPGANILVVELKTGATTNSEGKFQINNVPGGNYTIRISYVGHTTEYLNIVVPSAQANNIESYLNESAISLSEVVVTGNPFRINPKEISQPLLSLEHKELSIRSGTTIAQMINYQPGIAVQSNGVATGRPVIRGLGSNRVLILEDGLRMGDLSNTSPDHSVTQDGISAERIEILRGPASLLYGSNAIGGVINVLTNIIPKSVPQKLEGKAQLNYGSNSNNKSGQLHLGYGINSFAMHGDIFKRKSNDYKDPNGNKVNNSGIESEGYKFGTAYNPVWGSIGGAVNGYTSKYGIPNDPSIISEEGPISIDMTKTEYRFLTDVDSIDAFISEISLKAGYQNYSHNEVASFDGEVHSKFTLDSFSGDLAFRQSDLNLINNLKGVFGIWYLNQRYKVDGEEALTPNSNYNGIAFYIIEQLKVGSFNLQLGGRFESSLFKIPRAVISDSIFNQREKRFNSFSGSFGVVYTITPNVNIYTNIANAFRAPTIEELSSYATHAATGTFDIGNFDLISENNFGFDFGVRHNFYDFYFEASGFYNNIENYIYRKFSGLFYSPDSEINDSLGIPVVGYAQNNSILYGFEGKAIYDFQSGYSLQVMMDYVNAQNSITKEYLPFITPMRITLEARYSTDYNWFGLMLISALNQKNVAESEEETPGYVLIDVYGGIKMITGELAHQIDIKIENLFNKKYVDHLSLIKSFAFMPGRNFQINYKLLF